MKKQTKIIFSCFAAFVFVLSAFTLYTIQRDERAGTKSEKTTVKVTLEDGEYRLEGETRRRPLPEDYWLDLSGFNQVTITGRFSRDIPENQQLVLRIDNLRVNMYVNDKLIYQYGKQGSIPSYVKSPGNVWDSLVSPGIRTTDRVTFELRNLYDTHVNSTFKTFLANLYSGYESDLMAANIYGALPNFFASILIACMGVVAAGFALVLHRIKRPVFSALAFSGLSISSGVWFFINFTVQAYFVPLPVFNNSLDVLSLLFTATFAMTFFAANVKNNTRSLMLLIAGAWLVLAAAGSPLQLMGIMDYYDLGLSIQLMSAISVASIAISLILEWRRYPGGDTKILIGSTVLICAGIVGDLISSCLELIPFIFWFKIGFFLFMLVQFWQMAQMIQGFVSENARVRSLEAQREELEKVLEYERLLAESTKGLYESIYELDITHNCAANQDTRRYFAGLGMRENSTYDEILRQIAEKQIKEEYRQGYVEMFSTKNVLKAYQTGRKSLSYDFMISMDGTDYYWMRLTARIFYWKDGDSVRMIIYRQNIDEEKKREIVLYQQAKQDSLTGLHNKAVTQALISETITSYEAAAGRRYAFFILDIDDFKNVNDTFGHAIGDFAIKEFAGELRAQFGDSDIVGRVGGDEFAAFLPISNKEWVEKKAGRLVECLSRKIMLDAKECALSASVGIALFPEDGRDFETLYQKADKALYFTKAMGKNGFTIFSQEIERKNGAQSRITQAGGTKELNALGSGSRNRIRGGDRRPG